MNVFFLKSTVLSKKTDFIFTYSTEQRLSWEANSFSTSQETPRVLWNPNYRYRIHKFLPPVPILSQLDPSHIPTSHFLKIHLTIILPSTPGSSYWSLSLRFPHQNPVHATPFPHTRYMPHPTIFYITVFRSTFVDYSSRASCGTARRRFCELNGCRSRKQL